MSLVLQEILTGDQPSDLIEKLNYNFDQIVLCTPELQIVKGDKGSPGEDGISGLNGATWFNNSGLPNTLTPADFFRPVIPGDYYINKDDGEVWYYDPLLSQPDWVQLGFSLKAEDEQNNEDLDSLFELSSLVDSGGNSINIKNDVDGSNKVSLFVTQDPLRLTSDLTSANLIVSKPSITDLNMLFTIDGVTTTSNWASIDIQRPFIGVDEKTQLVINSELVKISSTDRITFSPGLSGFTEIESGRLQFPTTLDNQESDITVTTSGLRIRGKLIGSEKFVTLEDSLLISKDLIISNNEGKIIFPSSDSSFINDDAFIQKRQLGGATELLFSVGNDFDGVSNDFFHFGGKDSNNVYNIGASINSQGDASFKDLIVNGPFTSVITPVLGGVSAGTGLTGGGISPNTGGNITISHSDTSTVLNSNIQDSSEINTNGGFVIRNFNFDGFGHVTTYNTKNLDTRYYKKSEIDSTFIPKNDFIKAVEADYTSAYGIWGNRGPNVTTASSSNIPITLSNVPYYGNRAGYSFFLGSIFANPLVQFTVYDLLIHISITMKTRDGEAFIFTVNGNSLSTPVGWKLSMTTGGMNSDGSDNEYMVNGSSTHKFIVNAGTTTSYYVHIWVTNDNAQSLSSNSPRTVQLGSVSTSYSLVPRTAS